MLSKGLSKSEWRVYFKKQTDLFLSSKNKDEVASKWISSLVTFFKDKKGIWGIFSPLQGEPPVDQFLDSQNINLDFQNTKLDQSLKTQKKILNVVYPKIDDQEIHFFKAEKFELHPWGIKEPKEGELVDSEKIQGILVPGLGFNHKGQRLGKGKGFYDRYLKNYKGIKVGACFEFQYTNEDFPVDAWDICMDSVLTENGLKIIREG